MTEATEPEIVSAVEEAVPESPPKSPSLFKSFSVIAVVTIVSKILGLVRDQMIAHAYGAAMVSDAYLYAFQIPSFSLVLLGGLGGPFHTATVSVLSKIVSGDGPPSQQAQDLINTFITVTSIAFGAVMLIVFFFAPQVIDMIAHQASGELKEIAATHLRWMSPMLLIGGIIGIFYGVANVYHRFFWASFGPSMINVTLIAWLLFLGPDTAGMALAVSTMLGAVLQLAVQIPDYFKTGFRLFPAFHFHDKDLKTMGELLFPATIGTTIGQLNIYVAMFFISQLSPGGWTATMLGNRLIQLPIGVLIIAMLVPLFPRFSRWVGEKNYPALREGFRDGILTLWLLSFPIVALIFLIGEQSVALLFERGAFDHQATMLVTSVLVVLSLSIVPYMLRDGITRVFYAFNDSKTPLIAGLTSIVINAGLNALLVKPYGVAGIAFATVVVTVCNAIILSVLVRNHIQDLELRKLFPPAMKMLVAATVAAGIGWVTLQGLHSAYAQLQFSQLHLRSLVDILSTCAVVGLSYFAMLLAVKDSLTQRLYSRLSKAVLKR